MRKSKTIRTLVSALLLLALCIGLCACIKGGAPAKISAWDLMTGVTAREIDGKASDDEFVRSQAELAVKLFRAAAKGSNGKNLLISPLSVQLALAMAANGARGETLSEMEALLGNGMSIDELNTYLRGYIEDLPSRKFDPKLHMASSIWLRDDGLFNANEDFLQKNADYYGSDVYKAPFDKTTLDDVNLWTKQNTNGMIDKMLDEIDESSVMLLINTLFFDGQWLVPYTDDMVKSGKFTSITGETRNVPMMHATLYDYISDGNATGFIKDFNGTGYAFAAILPNEGIDVYDYVDSMSADGILNMLGNASGQNSVTTQLPKFSHEYELSMKELLCSLSMESAFNGSSADFSGIGSSELGNLFISDVTHKTCIEVSERGTVAGAATAVDVNGMTLPRPDSHQVILDRPFVYMIIDTRYNLPIFMGVVADI